MIASHSHDDTTCVSWDQNDTETEPCSITRTWYNDKIDEFVIEFDEFDNFHKQEIRAYHNNKTRIKTKDSVKFKNRKNNRRMNHNSGSFWHVQN